MKTPLFLFAITYIAALICSFFFHGTALICGMLMVLGIALFFVLRRQGLAWYLCLLVLVFGLGFGYGELREALTPENPFPLQELCEVKGIVVNDPALTDSGCKCQLKAETLNGKELKKPLKIIVLAEKSCDLRYGDALTVSGSFLSSEVLNPGGFDYAVYLEQRNIYGTLSALYGGEVTVDSSGHGNGFLKIAYFLKSRFETALSCLPLEQQAIIKGIFFGDTGGVDHAAADVLTKSGIRHCFAVSGLHVGYVVLFLGAFCNLLKLGRKARVALCMPCLLLYAAMTGFSPSVMRATVMCLMVFGSQLLGRERNSFNGLGAAALLLLLWDPSILLQSGFQLSFMAMLSILLLVPWLNGLFPGDFPGKGPLFVTVAAQIGMVPILAYQFHVVSFVSFLVSTLCCLLVGVMVLLCFMALFLSILSPVLGSLLLIPCGLLGQLILDGVSAAVTVPFAYLYKGDFSLLLLLLMYAVIVLAVLLPRTLFQKRLSAVVLLFAFLLFLLPPFSGEKELTVTFLAVGEGDAAYIHTPDGKDLLIDAGDAKDGAVTYYTLRPFLLSQGVSEIDALYLSHSDTDHSGGAEYLEDYFAVSSYVIAAAADETYQGADFMADNASVRCVKQGDVLDLDQGVKLTVLYPDGDVKAEDNDLSMVLRLSYGDFSVLFTGDIGEKAIAALLEQQGDLQADILKIPHHGSKHSYDEEFYQRVAPKEVVISVGKNGYGHPDAKVVSYFEDHYIPCYRTDIYGAVTVTSDGSGYELVTHRDDPQEP